MGDEQQRALERRWKETGSIQDEAAYLQAQLRAGELERERVQWAAALGHAAAKALRLESFDGEFEDCLASDVLAPAVTRAYACDCAERVLSVYALHDRDEVRLAEAIARSRSFAKTGEGDAALRALDDERHWPHRDLFDPEAPEEAVRSARAAAVGDAAGAARFAARCRALAVKEGLATDVDRHAEEAWQRERLIGYLLRRAGGAD